MADIFLPKISKNISLGSQNLSKQHIEITWFLRILLQLVVLQYYLKD